MIERIEDTLNGGYRGLYGEVVKADTYRLKQLKFIPDVIFDYGANVGIFTRYARELFPNALIISVEPNKDNYDNLTKFTKIDNWIPINKAIGKGKMFHNLGATNGSGESYVSAGIGYDQKEMEEAVANKHGVEDSEIECILPAELIKQYVKQGQKFLVKMDIEGGEHAVFTDKESMDLIRTADYFCAELHPYALHAGQLYDDMLESLKEAKASFADTHIIEVDETVHFYAIKK